MAQRKQTHMQLSHDDWSSARPFSFSISLRFFIYYFFHLSLYCPLSIFPSEWQEFLEHCIIVRIKKNGHFAISYKYKEKFQDWRLMAVSMMCQLNVPLALWPFVFFFYYYCQFLAAFLHQVKTHKLLCGPQYYTRANEGSNSHQK